ncbi:MAG: hypothetical protein ACTSPQ_12130 [Candidatus Helarchaeota archaeon]
MTRPNQSTYLDYVEDYDIEDLIEIDVQSKVVVNSKAKIRMKFIAKKEYPAKTQFRFVIPYGWTPINIRPGFCKINSEVVGKIKKTDFQITITFVIKEPLQPGKSVEFIYNEKSNVNTAGCIAYFDPVYCAIDIKLPKSKLFTRIALKKVQMVSDNAKFLMVKIPIIYHGDPVDIEIVALDRYGNRDYNFNAIVNINGDKCLEFPNEAELRNGYVKLEKALKFKNSYYPDSKLSSLLKDNKGYNDFPVAPELMHNIGRLYVSYNEIKGSSNPIIWDKDYDEQVFWGDTHIHTREYSDGIGTANDGILYARDVVLHDFAALGDHLNQRFNIWMEGRKMLLSCPYTRETWLELVNLCKKYTDDSFIVIPAYEWSGRVAYIRDILQIDCPYEAISDKVILFPLDNAENAPLVDYISKDGCFQSDLYNKLKDTECVIISHTTISWPMGTSWIEVDNDLEKVVEIYSMHGSSEEYGGGYRPLLTNRKNGSVLWALKHGIKLGFIAGGDDHYTHPGCPIEQHDLKNLIPVLRYRPGIAAIFSKKLTSRNLIKNLNLRKCYATTGERMWIKIKIEQALMGEEIQVSNPPIIIVTVCGTDIIESVELIKNGEVIAVRVPGTDRIKFAYIDNELKNEEFAFYYVRVTQFNRARGWSSPIWVKARYNINS